MSKERDEQKQDRRRLSMRTYAESDTGTSSNYLSLPPECKLWKPKKAGTYKLNIIPYITGVGNPGVKNQKGVEYIERTYYTHVKIGAAEKTYVCPQYTFNERCPICEHQLKLKNDPEANEKVAKALWRKIRQLWNVQVLSEPGNANGSPNIVQVWEVSFHNFGEAFKKRLLNDEDHEYDFCCDPQDGFLLKITGSEESGGGFSYIDFSSFEFKPRGEREHVTQEILDQAWCLDDFPVRVGYDELSRIHFGEKVDDDEDDRRQETAPERPVIRRPREESSNGHENSPEAPAPRRPTVPVSTPPARAERPVVQPAEREAPNAAPSKFKIGDMIWHNTLGVCEIAKISPDGSSLRVVDDNQDAHNAQDPDDCELYDPKKHRAPATPLEVDDVGSSADDTGNGADAGGLVDEAPTPHRVNNTPQDGFGDPDEDDPDAAPPPAARRPVQMEAPAPRRAPAQQPAPATTRRSTPPRR